MKLLKCNFFALVLFITFNAFGDIDQNSHTIFSDSPDGDELYDSSWGYVEKPSELELAGGNDKFPVETEHYYKGVHSLRLHWTSRAGGDWGLAVASQGWQPMDFTEYDSLVFWINGPESIPADVLPALSLEDISNTKGPHLSLAGLVKDVDADENTWQRISLPVSVFIDAGGPDFTKIKTVYFYQDKPDNTEHIAWLDEIRIVKKEKDDNVPPAAPVDLAAEGADQRIDLKWQRNTEEDLQGYNIYRSDSENGPFEKINNTVHTVHLYSDFFGENDKTYYYRVTAVDEDFLESDPSASVHATSESMTEEELLTSVQRATFRYFYDYGHPVSGLARERKGDTDRCASGGTGFALMNFPVAVERSFISRQAAAERVLTILQFLNSKAERYHGAWAHWINGTTGETMPFSQYDNGGDLVETAYLVQGLLTVRQYFDTADDTERQIRELATSMWESVEWDWYQKDPADSVLYWHWSPDYGWRMDMPIRGFNETMIVYILAISSPTHSVPKYLYDKGWAGSGYWHGKTHYGHLQWVGPELGGPLFFTHYSFLGFDPREHTDKYCNYFENNRNITRIHRDYCIDNPENHQGYGENVWGLTASDDPWGYRAHSPTNDNGTITPTAAVSAMPYTPEESIAALKHFYYELGDRLWGEFGFKDAFNLGADWFATSFLAIDQGTIVPMIENYRTGLCWSLFMDNDEITRVEKKDSGHQKKECFGLMENYPNPFNPFTTIRFQLPFRIKVSMDVYDVTGKLVATLLNEKPMPEGEHHIRFESRGLASGIYFYKMHTTTFNETKKMTIMR